jgi:hypothetical protein
LGKTRVIKNERNACSVFFLIVTFELTALNFLILKAAIAFLVLKTLGF